MNDNAPAPTLIEPGVRYFLSKSLEQCHKVKEYYHTRHFNFVVGIAFFICLGIFLSQSKGIPMDARIHPAGNGMGMLTNLPLWKSPDEEYWTRSYA